MSSLSTMTRRRSNRLFNARWTVQPTRNEFTHEEQRCRRKRLTGSVRDEDDERDQAQGITERRNASGRPQPAEVGIGPQRGVRSAVDGIGPCHAFAPFLPHAAANVAALHRERVQRVNRGTQVLFPR